MAERYYNTEPILKIQKENSNILKSSLSLAEDNDEIVNTLLDVRKDQLNATTFQVDISENIECPQETKEEVNKVFVLHKTQEENKKCSQSPLQFIEENKEIVNSLLLDPLQTQLNIAKFDYEIMENVERPHDQTKEEVNDALDLHKTQEENSICSQTPLRFVEENYETVNTLLLDPLQTQLNITKFDDEILENIERPHDQTKEEVNDTLDLHKTQEENKKCSQSPLQFVEENKEIVNSLLLDPLQTQLNIAKFDYEIMENVERPHDQTKEEVNDALDLHKTQEENSICSQTPLRFVEENYETVNSLLLDPLQTQLNITKFDDEILENIERPHDQTKEEVNDTLDLHKTQEENNKCSQSSLQFEEDKYVLNSLLEPLQVQSNSNIVGVESVENKECFLVQTNGEENGLTEEQHVKGSNVNIIKKMECNSIYKSASVVITKCPSEEKIDFITNTEDVCTNTYDSIVPCASPFLDETSSSTYYEPEQSLQNVNKDFVINTEECWELESNWDNIEKFIDDSMKKYEIGSADKNVQATPPTADKMCQTDISYAEKNVRKRLFEFNSEDSGRLKKIKLLENSSLKDTPLVPIIYTEDTSERTEVSEDITMFDQGEEDILCSKNVLNETNDWDQFVPPSSQETALELPKDPIHCLVDPKKTFLRLGLSKSARFKPLHLRTTPSKIETKLFGQRESSSDDQAKQDSSYIDDN